MSSNIVVKTDVQKIVVKNADGKDGKSAYMQAVEGGYTGTEQDFNLTLNILADIKQVKQDLVDAIEYKGGESSADKSLQGIAEDIRDIPNFNSSGFFYKETPKNVFEIYALRDSLEKVFNDIIVIYHNNVFNKCINLYSVNLPELKFVYGNNIFLECLKLKEVLLPSLLYVEGNAFLRQCSSLEYLSCPLLNRVNQDFLYNCTSLKEAYFPSLQYILASGAFGGLTSITNLEVGRLLQVGDFLYRDNLTLRNFTIGKGTDIDLPFQKWTATNVIAEGQGGIDELNSNLYNNLLTKLYDHSTDGQTRTLRLGWLAHVTQENIDYANSKGWTLTT